MNQYLTAGDLKSLALQFGFISGFILFSTYLIAFLCRSWTHVKSHLWVLICVIVASVLTFIFYRICVAFELNIWLAFVLLVVLWGGPVDKILYNIDKGRTLIDIDPKRKVLFRTDYRVIRLNAQMAFMMLYFYF